MAANDINGKKINWGDRITRNALFCFLFVVYGFQFIAPYFISPPVPPIDAALIKGLESAVMGVVWYLIGRNTQPANESKPEQL